MRKPIIAGNWKMFKTVTEAATLVREVRSDLDAVGEVECVLCPPFTSLSVVAELVKGTGLRVGAQNMHWEDQGAFTGEVSPLMVKELCQYVIIGHSERRQYFGETDESVNRKVKAALKHGLIPIVCVGENLTQNEAGLTDSVVSGQVRAALADLAAAQVSGLVIAYEPIWAIGTGKAATGNLANRTIGTAVRGTINQLYGAHAAQSVRIQYGGSVSPDNISEFMSQPEIDGALVGGASLVAAKFVPIVRQAAASKRR
ncbi:MAG TPA: triose-phosphate isomerase [Anaerolineae bacterium]|nr:triose-phosphate isomerase [Anaerolineae bacterium]HQJ50745.1 triose-phosphate isomerase [Anaerolineae bacterium]